MKGKFRRTLPPKDPTVGKIKYSFLWKLVDGAVHDTFRDHPDYAGTRHDIGTIRQSINKRVVGKIMAGFSQSYRASPKSEGTPKKRAEMTRE